MKLAAADVSSATWCIAVVYAADGVRFLAVGRSRAALISRLAVYVREQAPWKLWPDVATGVHDLLSSGALDVAIDLYFTSVGDRWDPEWLHAEETTLSTGTTTETGGLGEQNDHVVERRTSGGVGDSSAGPSALPGEGTSGDRYRHSTP